jgi:hypothetical protein
MSHADLVNGTCLSTEHTANMLSIVDKRDQTACKPGSVPPSKKRTRRSFLWTGPCGPVLATYPDGSGRRGPAGARRLRRVVPIRSCSRRGLPCRPRRRVRGGLLPHPFTLAARSRKRGLAVCFLWRCPWGRPRRVLPVAFSPWSPDFPPPPRGAGATARPSDPAEEPRSRSVRRQAWDRIRAISLARVSPSAAPSTRPGRQCRWKALTTLLVASS